GRDTAPACERERLRAEREVAVPLLEVRVRDRTPRAVDARPERVPLGIPIDRLEEDLDQRTPRQLGGVRCVHAGPGLGDHRGTSGYGAAGRAGSAEDDLDTDLRVRPKRMQNTTVLVLRQRDRTPDLVRRVGRGAPRLADQTDPGV